MDLRINISKFGQHYCYTMVSGTFFSEKEIYEKMKKDYPEEDGFEISLSRVYQARRVIEASDLTSK